VLYHRWQIKGRLETAAPYWIAGAMDGAGSSFYTMGSRRQKNWDTYFQRALRSMRAIRSLVEPGTFFVQIVGFSNQELQLPRYLKMMDEAGFVESSNDVSSRIWRKVPNRKWHAEQRGATSGSKELVLIHRAKA
jgi:hypothetical protein